MRRVEFWAENTNLQHRHLQVRKFSGKLYMPKKGSFLLIPPPPPTVKAQNLILPPHAETNSSLIGLNSLVRELKHYAAYYFAYPLRWGGGGGRVKSVGGGGGELNQWGEGGLTEKIQKNPP